MKVIFLSALLFICCTGSFAQTQVWRHSDTIQGIYGAADINIDVNNYLYVAGPAFGTLDTVTGQPAASLVFKLDKAGNYYWTQGFMIPYNVTYDGMAGDYSGNSYLFGEYFTDGIQWFNGFLTRVDSSGNLVWTKHFDYEDYLDVFNNAIVDNNGNVLVAGTSDDSFADQNMISIKYPAADTTPIYSERLFDSIYFYNSYFAQTDYAGGQYSLGQAVVTENAANSIILLKYNSTGAFQWEQVYNSTPFSDEEPASTNVDSSGNLFIADNTNSGEGNDFNYVPYLLKVTKAGSTAWSNVFTDIANNYNLTCSALDSSYFYIGGSCNDSIFMAKLSATTGATIWKYSFGAGMGSLYKMTVRHDSIYATGIFYNPLGGSEFFTAELAPSGSLMWFATYQDSLNGEDGAYSLVTDNSGGIYVAGQSFEQVNANGSATVIKYQDNGINCVLTIDSISTTVLANDSSANGMAIATVSGGTGNYTYHWSNGGSSSSITGLTAALYCLTVTDNINGCEAISCDSVVPSLCQLQIDTAIISYSSYCYPSVSAIITVSAAGNIGSLKYSADSGHIFQSSNLFANLVSGNYYIAARDSYGCVSIYSHNPVNIPSAIADTPTISVSGDTLSTGTYSSYDWYCSGTHSYVSTNPSLIATDSICGAIWVQVKDSHGCTYISSSFDDVCEGITSLSVPTLTMTVYPNPFGDRFNVKLEGNQNNGVEVALFDLCGQKLYEAQPTFNAFSIPAAGLASGMYLLRLQAGEKFLYQQVIKE